MAAQPRRIGPAAIPLTDMLDSWERSLAAEHKADTTIKSYRIAVSRLAGHTTDITTGQLRAFFAAELARVAPASAAVTFRSLRVFFNWLSAEEPSLMPVSPMTGMKPPVVPRKRKPPLEDDEVRALLATCAKDTFDNRRDAAIIRVLIDTGMRISGLAGLRILWTDAHGNDKTDVSLTHRYLVITLKGGDETAVPIGKKTAAALDRYLRARVRHRLAGQPWLWLSPRGQYTTWGIRQMLYRRAKEAGLDDVYPHRFRRTFAQSWLNGGGQEFDLMKIAGWSSREMIAVYAGELSEDRARAAHARLSPGDRI